MAASPWCSPRTSSGSRAPSQAGKRPCRRTRRPVFEDGGRRQNPKCQPSIALICFITRYAGDSPCRRTIEALCAGRGTGIDCAACVSANRPNQAARLLRRSPDAALSNHLVLVVGAHASSRPGWLPHGGWCRERCVGGRASGHERGATPAEVRQARRDCCPINLDPTSIPVGLGPPGSPLSIGASRDAAGPSRRLVFV